MFQKEDIKYIKASFKQAQKAKGFQRPNPSVGCVIVKNNQIIAKSFHEKFGEAHAEVNAIKKAKKNGVNLKGATIYVSLSPCTKQGKTPSCLDLIIKEKISKVVFSVNDPSDKTAIKILNRHNIKVVSRVLENEGKEIIKEFIINIKNKRPYVVAKIAMTLDGKIATKTHDSKWITNAKTRAFSRKMRSKHQAIIVGVNTLIQDNSLLSTRLKGHYDPIPVIIDPELKSLPNLKVFKSNLQKIIFTRKKTSKTFKNTKIIMLPKSKFNSKTMLEKLWDRNIKSVLIEGGSFTINSFIKDNSVDAYDLFIAPKITGDTNSLSAFNFQNIKLINESKNFIYKKIKQIDQDLYIRMEEK